MTKTEAQTLANQLGLNHIKTGSKLFDWCMKNGHEIGMSNFTGEWVIFKGDPKLEIIVARCM